MFILFINLALAAVYAAYLPSDYANPVVGGLFLAAVINAAYIYKLMRDNKRLKFRLDEEFLRASKAGAVSITDQLTGAYNRRHFDIVFDRIYEESRSRNTGFSLILIDIDYFKRFNDTYGHDTGDAVLKTVVSTIKRNIRKNLDMFFRYGGEEFVIITSDSKAGAVNLARKINGLDYRQVEKITISAGVAFFRNGISKDEIIKIADNNLYKAKEQGRNRVIYDEDN